MKWKTKQGRKRTKNGRITGKRIASKHRKLKLVPYYSNFNSRNCNVVKCNPLIRTLTQYDRYMQALWGFLAEANGKQSRFFSAIRDFRFALCIHLPRLSSISCHWMDNVTISPSVYWITFPCRLRSVEVSVQLPSRVPRKDREKRV